MDSRLEKNCLYANDKKRIYGSKIYLDYTHLFFFISL
jgi:hypothetical protein